MTVPALPLDAVESAEIRGAKTHLRPMRPDEAPRFYTWATGLRARAYNAD